jgi:hypothetical protein
MYGTINVESANFIRGIPFWHFFPSIIVLHRNQADHLGNSCLILRVLVVTLKKTRSRPGVPSGGLQSKCASVVLPAGSGGPYG